MRSCNSGITAIILAAGFSSRMGAFKPLLPFDENSVIETAVNSFRQAGIFDIRVVIGHHADRLLPVLKKLQVMPVLNACYEDGMFSSVLAGVRTFDSQTKAFFLLPVDTPLVKRYSLKMMLKLYRQTSAAVIYPTFNGKRGHPPLIDQQCFGDILATEADGMLKLVLNKFSTLAIEVELPDKGLTLDMDTPEDYAYLNLYNQEKKVLVREEIFALLRSRQTPRVIRHCLAVAAVGRQLTKRLNKNGLNLDMVVITAGALLHDIAKGQHQHAQQGARLLQSFGYPLLAQIIVSHMDLFFDEHSLLNEAAIIFFADKVVREGRIINSVERFQNQLRKHAGQPEVLLTIEKRFQSWQKIRAAIIRVLTTKILGNTILPSYLRETI